MNTDQKDNQQWIAAYYPSELFKDDRAKTLASLLFDKIICHFPIAHTGCGGGVGISDFYSDDLLIQEGVIELREEFFVPEVDVKFTPGHAWGTEDEFNRYLELNITAMALECCKADGAVPVTDVRDAPIPAFALERLNISRASRLQASAVALQSLDLALPPFSPLSSEEILAARLKLRDELQAFRAGMLLMAPRIRTAVSDDASVADIYEEARYLADTAVMPALADLRQRLKVERGPFGRRLLQKSASRLPSIALKWTTKGTIASAIDAIGAGSSIALEQIERERLMESLRYSGGIGFLLSVSQLPAVRKKQVTKS